MKQSLLILVLFWSAGCLSFKSAKKRAVIAVARKLAVTLLALWKSNALYQPLLHAA